MRTVLIFASGFFVGGLVLRWLVIVAVRRDLYSKGDDPHYHPAARAILRHLATTGTINAVQAAAVLAVDRLVAMRHLDRMTDEQLIIRHGHQNSEFYTHHA